MGKFGDCCFEATSDIESRISKKNRNFLFVLSEIYDNTANFDNFPKKSEDIFILKGFWKEKAIMLMIEIIIFMTIRDKNYKLWIAEFSNPVGKSKSIK